MSFARYRWQGEGASAEPVSNPASPAASTIAAVIAAVLVTPKRSLGLTLAAGIAGLVVVELIV